jgi:endogenous inhibitor of DNA gyrase (YacG/DUF329 family)
VSKSKSNELKVNCPTCKKDVAWSDDSPFRPFCSDRCQKIDLGAWADESYTIPVENAEEWSGVQSEQISNSGNSQNFH